jgi:Snf7
LYRDVDKVHDMMDDIAEQQEVAREISEAISNPVAFGQDIDEVTSLFVLRKPYINFICCNRMNWKKNWRNLSKKN